MIGRIRGLLREYGNQHKIVFMFSLMVLFWTIFDDIMSYITPILIQENGFSMSMIGFIIGSSSVTGALFDFLISKFFKNTNYKRMFLILFAICAVYPFLLWQAKTLWFFLLVMAVWGIYFDLYGFGVFNFISRSARKKENSSYFGIVEIFRALGGMLTPLIIGLVVVDRVDWRAFSLGWVFLGVGFVFFLILLVLTRQNRSTKEISAEYPRRKNLFTELHLWKKIGRLISPVLFLTFFLFFTEAFFWTLAPLYAETANLKAFGGLFLTAYTLPALLVGWFVGSLTKRFGKKRTAFVGVLIGSLILSSFAFWPDSIISIVAVFLASVFISLSLPAINSAYADYISEAPQVEGEIEGLEDFAFNIGYMAGPVSAGILADVFSIPAAFSILGVMGAMLALILLAVTPRNINIKTRPSEL